jgi:hypothetical protein
MKSCEEGKARKRGAGKKGERGELLVRIKAKHGIAWA